MITLTIDKSTIELVLGIPEYLTVSTDAPSSVYYTLDGAVPDETSLVAGSRIYLPNNMPSFTISIIAISSTDHSDIYTEKFSTGFKGINGPYHIGTEGINIYPPGSEAVTSLGFDENGDPAQESSMVLEELDIMGSRQNYLGISTDDYGNGKTSKDFINLTINQAPTIVVNTSSPNDQNVFFDPKASFIEIDGTTQEKFDNQIVKIINRPMNTFDAVSRSYAESKAGSNAAITGNLVRSIYDPSTGLYVSYYYESKDCRWIVSTQKVDKKQLIINFNQDKSRFVFRWVEDRHMSKLY